MIIILLLMYLSVTALKLFHQPIAMEAKQIFIVVLTIIIAGDLIMECMEDWLARKFKEKLQKDKFSVSDMKRELSSQPLLWLFSLFYYILLAGLLHEVYILITKYQLTLTHVALLAVLFVILDLILFLYFFSFLNKRISSAIGLTCYFETQLIVKVTATVGMIALCIMGVSFAIIVGIIFLITLFVDF